MRKNPENDINFPDCAIIGHKIMALLIFSPVSRVPLSTLSSLAALLASVLLLLVGNGLLNSLVPIRGTLEGFAPVSVGIIGSMYFFGMLAGTLTAPMVLRRTGYVRAFCAFVSLAIIATLIMPVVVSPIAWMALRGAVGFAFA